MPGLGFPDFVAFQPKQGNKQGVCPNFRVIWVECKTNNTLDKEEKLKLNWMLKEGYECWIAYEENKEVKFRKFVEYVPGRRVCRKTTRD